MIETWVRDMVAILVGIVTVSGAILAAQWLYYWPKVLRVVKEAVGDAMVTEHEYVQREMSRIDSRPWCAWARRSAWPRSFSGCTRITSSSFLRTSQQPGK